MSTIKVTGKSVNKGVGEEDTNSKATIDDDWSKHMTIEFDDEPSGKNRVVFMSSKARTYFPEDPGSSRFGIAYSMNCAPGDVPNPNYLPSDDRLNKPVSTKGFGMGGLSAPRFAKDGQIMNPAPNTYQQWVAVPLPERKKKESKLKRSSAPETGEEKKVSAPKEPESQATMLLALEAKKKKNREMCLQTLIGFDSHLSESRFRKDAKFQNVGVGYYDIQSQGQEPTIRKACSFGGPPVRLIPPTVTRCNYEGYDKCLECDELLKFTDYYRTLKKIKNPFYDVNPNDRVGVLDLDEIILFQTTSGSSSLNVKQIFASLCRSCYCRAKRGQSPFWEKADVPKLFQKTRHCNYVHDHRNLEIFTHKTDCKIIRNLQRKEILLSKYYKDFCERIVKTKQSKF